MSESTTEKEHPNTQDTQSEAQILVFKKRMLQWQNPVEYVNNMYGCHPGDDNGDYFDKVFSE